MVAFFLSTDKHCQLSTGRLSEEGKRNRPTSCAGFSTLLLWPCFAATAAT